MDLNTPPPPGLGAWLLRRARDHGLTGTELADLLGLPSHRLRQITTVTDLDDLPLRTLRALSAALDLPWPGWLEPSTHPAPPPAAPPISAGQASDPGRVGAVLALVLGQPLDHSQIARALDWPAQRVRHALTRLADRTRERPGLRLILTGDQARLAVAPRTLDPATRRRLHQITLQQQGPPPGIAYLAYRLSYNNHKEALGLARRHPELLDNAVTAGYLTCQPDDDGHPASIQLTPDVAYSLGLTAIAPAGRSTAETPGQACPEGCGPGRADSDLDH